MDKSDIFERYKKDSERRLIQGLIPSLEGIQREIKDKRYPDVNLHSENGKKYWINADGVNVVIWDPSVIIYGELFPAHSLHRNCLEPKEFVERHVTTLEQAREIARVLNVSL